MKMNHNNGIVLLLIWCVKVNVWVRSPVSPYEIFNGHSGNGAGFCVVSLFLSFRRCSILIFIYTLLLPEGQIGEISNFLGNGGALDRKVLPRHQLVHHREMSVSIIKTNNGLSSYFTEKNFHYK